jgi:ribosome-binding protein aMBF1 (putative translation factor)
VNRGAVIIERERTARGWSNQQLAAEIGTDEGMTSRVRRGKAKPGRELSVRIRDRLGIDPALWDQEAEPEKGAA